MPVMCSICKKVFSTQSVHNRHVREVHQKVPDPISFGKNTVWSYRCLEQNCDNAFTTNARLMAHLETNHQMKFKTESYSMKNLNDFEKWKSDIENATRCSYVLKSKNSSTSGEIFYYNCNRSKTSYVPKENDERKRLQKSQGSSKMNHSCTSQVKVINEKNAITVEWQQVHYGHTFDLQHIKIPKLERQDIASKVINGVTPRRILETTRNNFGEHLKRIDLLTAKDIRNIKTSYGVESREGKRNSNDAFSVDLWVQECKSAKDNPVLLYKPQGINHEILQKNDFCLIIMNTFQKLMIKTFPKIITVDGTHGLNGYDFEMTTVMVIDEFHHGFPVAVMFSNRRDTVVQRIFFTSIKEVVGVVNTTTFMSDMAEMYFTAWVMVMGKGSEHLFCAWHVDRAWPSNLSKISDKEKRAEIYKLLKTLQQHTSDLSFFTALTNAISYMCNDKQTTTFGEYFKNTYGYNFRKWAYCFRQNSDINTNMHIEAMHKVIKYFYLERKTVKRLDKGLHVVLQYIRDKSVERLVRLTKGENTKQTKELTQSHKEAVKSCDNYTVINYCDMHWKMTKNYGVVYDIYQLLDKKCCEQVCIFCKVCNHMYSCECKYYKRNNRICKHIHILMAKLNTTAETSDSQIFNCVDKTSETDVLLSALSQSSNTKQDVEKKIRGLITNLENIDYNELDYSVICQIHHHLLISNNLSKCPKLLAMDDEFKVRSQSTKRVIDPQIRFMSTKKKRVVASTSFMRPVTQEIMNIQESLEHSSQDNSQEKFIFKSVSPSCDHQYC